MTVFCSTLLMFQIGLDEFKQERKDVSCKLINMRM